MRISRLRSIFINMEAVRVCFLGSRLWGICSRTLHYQSAFSQERHKLRIESHRCSGFCDNMYPAWASWVTPVKVDEC